MASRRISIINKGFTLIEMLIVIGLIAIVGAVAAFVDINSFRGDAFRAERATIVTLLGQARIDSLNNVGEVPHGLAFFPTDEPESYVLFEGTSYAASDPATRVPYKAAYKIVLEAGSPTEVYFEQLSGNAHYVGSGLIRLTDPNRGFSFDIALNQEGGIIW
jgi:prepilin-type N-terminal cleavage/methylation domain-containing protein